MFIIFLASIIVAGVKFECLDGEGEGEGIGAAFEYLLTVPSSLSDKELLRNFLATFVFGATFDFGGNLIKF